jgi:WD40 repeat protein
VHPEAIRSIAWSPDGTRLATGSADKSIRIWDGTTLNPLFLMEGHQGWVESVAWSPDGITLASASRDGSIRFWDAETGVELHALSGSQGHVGEVVSLAFSPDGRMLVSGGEDGAKIWFLPHFMRNRPMLKARALLKQGQDLARRGQLTKSISILEGLVEDEHIGAEARQHLESTKRSHNQFFAQDRMGVKGDHRQWVPPKVTLADGTILQVARMATVFDRDPVGDIGRTGGWLKQIDWSSDHRRLATISTYGLQKWDPFSRSFVDLKSAARTNDTGADIEITVIAWSPDGKKLAAGYQDGVIRVMQEDGREMRLLQKGDSSISSVAWSPDGELLAASCWRSVQVWNVASGSEAQQFSLSNINHLFWRSNEAILAVGDGKVSELDLSTRLSQARMSSSGSPCVLSPDGKWLAFVSDNVAIDVYCTATWSRKHYLREHTGKVNALAWSPDSRVLASGAGGGDPSVRDYSVRLWDVVAGRQICILEGHWYDVQAIAWSPDGKALVTGSRWSDLVAWWLPYYAPEHCEASDSD